MDLDLRSSAPVLCDVTPCGWVCFAIDQNVCSSSGCECFLFINHFIRNLHFKSVNEFTEFYSDTHGTITACGTDMMCHSNELRIYFFCDNIFYICALNHICEVGQVDNVKKM